MYIAAFESRLEVEEAGWTLVGQGLPGRTPEPRVLGSLRIPRVPSFPSMLLFLSPDAAFKVVQSPANQARPTPHLNRIQLIHHTECP